MRKKPGELGCNKLVRHPHFFQQSSVSIRHRQEDQWSLVSLALPSFGEFVQTVMRIDHGEGTQPLATGAGKCRTGQHLTLFTSLPPPPPREFAVKLTYSRFSQTKSVATHCIKALFHFPSPSPLAIISLFISEDLT
jgi:hypothetical protein